MADFDDQAWGIESDDEEFVTRVAPRTNVPRSLKSAGSRSCSYTTRPTNERNRASWTLVDKVNAKVQQSEGIPPTEIAAEELNRDDSGSGFQLIANEEASGLAEASSSSSSSKGKGVSLQEQPPPSGFTRTAARSLDRFRDEARQEYQDNSEQEQEAVGARNKSVKRKGRPGKREAQVLRRAIRPDLDHLIADPAHALSRLTLSWNAASHVATPVSESGPVTISAPPSASSEFTFDPVAAAGDGLIMAGSSFVEAIPDNANSIAGTILPAGSQDGSFARKRSVRSSRRQQQLLSCLSKPSVDLAVLRSLAWAGLPDELRPMVWQLLLGYLPAVSAVRPSTLSRKRAEYAAGVKLAFAKGVTSLDQTIWHQIHIDVPRTNPGIRLWQRDATQRALERILYVWAIRHPASGYVQGINDLATPFFQVFLSAYIDSDPEMYDVALLPPDALEALEADTFWCLSKLLDGIQDNYIFAQPGIQRQMRRMGELVARIDAPLHAHLQEQGVEYMQFAFRWMNCLLMREMSVRNIVRMWDTYLAEGSDAFSDFHLYVCSVFLHKWTDTLKQMDFQGIIMFLQSLPTSGWSDKDAEMLLSEAFMYKTLFGNTAHLNK